LVEVGASVNTLVGLQCPHAAVKGNVAVLALEVGINVNAMAKTALVAAAVGVVKQLLELGADVNVGIQLLSSAAEAWGEGDGTQQRMCNTTL
jgi:hypothetical protein